MFNAKDYYDLTPNSPGKAEPKQCTHEGHCIINAARVEFPNWRYE